LREQRKVVREEKESEWKEEGMCWSGKGEWVKGSRRVGRGEKECVWRGKGERVEGRRKDDEG
jgi:hypothetical protein